MDIIISGILSRDWVHEMIREYSSIHVKKTLPKQGGILDDVGVE